MIYRAELSERVLGQLGRFPAVALDALVATMAEVVEYPTDPLRTFPTDDPYMRIAEFGGPENRWRYLAATPDNRVS